MTTEEHTMDNYPEQNGLLCRENIKAYALTMFGIAAIIALYYILTGPAAAMQPPEGQPPSGPPGQSPPPIGGSGLGSLNSWPLWGQLVLPSLLGLIFGVVIVGAFALVATFIYKKKGARSSIFVIVPDHCHKSNPWLGDWCRSDHWRNQ